MRKGSQTSIPGRRALRRSRKLLQTAFIGMRLNPRGPHAAFLSWVLDRKDLAIV